VGVGKAHPAKNTKTNATSMICWSNLVLRNLGSFLDGDEPPNGMAQAQRRRRGGATIIIASLLARRLPLGCSRCRLQPVLACYGY
jgi:hypothetical protein